ncbi:MAG TPA: outer membrane beta-barrel protein [Candidatus Acidoferrales bacterium]|nr:outer membrane beta-barrel protein [Candidatus Acidoferrales bacterium]
MKTLLVILLFPAMALCQGFLPRWELSLSGDVNSISSNNSYVSFDFRSGFYPILGEGLSIEPELSYGRTKGINAADISGNLSYGVEMGYWPVVPFVLLGYGLGDGIPFYEPMTRATKNSTDVSVLNVGLGAKVMAFGGRGLIRLEYRYQGFSENFSGFTGHVYGRRLLLGIAILL